MLEYLGRWEFWVAVIVVSFITHYAIGKLMGSGMMGGSQST